MPIPRDPEQRYSKLIEPSYDMRTNTSEENVSIDFHDGPLPGFSSWDTAEIEGVGPKENEPKSNGGGVCTSDRNELMERIKRGESPTWVPSQTVCPLWEESYGSIGVLDIYYGVSMLLQALFAGYLPFNAQLKLALRSLQSVEMKLLRAPDWI